MIRLKLTKDIEHDLDAGEYLGFIGEEVTLIEEEDGKEFPYLVENTKGIRYCISKDECECVVENA